MHGGKQHSSSFIHSVDIVWMYLHWRFLNGHWAKYLKCHKYAHGGLAQTYQCSSKPHWGFGMGSSSFVYLCWSLQIHRLSRGFLRPLLSYTFSLLGLYLTYSIIYYKSNLNRMVMALECCFLIVGFYCIYLIMWMCILIKSYFVTMEFCVYLEKEKTNRKRTLW